MKGWKRQAYTPPDVVAAWYHESDPSHTGLFIYSTGNKKTPYLITTYYRQRVRSAYAKSTTEALERARKWMKNHPDGKIRPSDRDP